MKRPFRYIPSGTRLVSAVPDLDWDRMMGELKLKKEAREAKAECPYCEEPPREEESLDDFRHLNAEEGTCHHCLVRMAEAHECGKNQGGCW